MKVETPKSRVELMFRALSDRTRLRIVHLLRQGETCVCDLVAVIKSPQPKISRHLAYLRRAGIVDARRDGQWIYYRLAPAKSRLHEKLLECLDACSVEVPELNRDAERLTRSGRSCCD